MRAPKLTKEEKAVFLHAGYSDQVVRNISSRGGWDGKKREILTLAVIGLKTKRALEESKCQS